MTNREIGINFDQFAGHALKEIGDVLVARARENMDLVSYGRTYIINGKPHIASRRHDTANNLSYDLWRTIRYKVEGNVLEFGAGDQDVDYARWLEKEADRPNYTKSIEESETKINEVLSRLFIDALELR